MSDVLQQVGVVIREVRSREHDGKQARVVIASREYDTTADDLWDALTNPERIPRWFLPISGELRLGGRYQLQGNAGGEITACEPPRRLAVTWEFTGISWLTVELEPQAETRTRLTLEHMAHLEGDFWDRFGPGAVGVGWDGLFRSLGLHIATRQPVDPAKTQAWSMSDEGRAFTRAWSEDWGRAAVADGDEIGMAQKAVERVVAFYTGAPVPD